MNVVLSVQAPIDTAKIAHGVMAYERATDELDVELPIPLFLDTLTLKIARLPRGQVRRALLPVGRARC